MSTPVSDGKLLYVVRDGGVVFALDVKTSRTVYIRSVCRPAPTASPILADGKIYVTTEEDGITTVLGRAEVRDSVVELAAWRLCALLFEYLSRFPTGKSSSAWSSYLGRLSGRRSQRR